GVEALRRALSREVDAPQVVVTAKDLYALIEQVNSVNRANLLDAAGTGSLPATVHARPNIPTPYVAPSTENERRLAEIWQATLGIEQVGVNDNFFDLGGDSILGIQVIARASDAGFQLSPDQLFEHQTIAELAKLFGEVAPEAEAPVAGPLPVTLFQRQLLESPASVDCWSMIWPLPAETSAGAAGDVLRRALEHVAKRHPALGARFTRGPEGWTQTATILEAVPVREEDLSAGADVAIVAGELRTGLDPERGVLLGAAVLGDGDAGPKRGLLVVHPVAADRTSWDVLRDEVRTACRQFAAGEEVSLPAVTGSFFRWLSAAPGTEVAWTAPLQDEAVSAEPATVVPVRLGGEETRILLEEIPELQRVRVEEVVLAALARTLSHGAGGGPVRLALEVEARDSDPRDLDLSRTVGCFTVALPVALDLGDAGDPGEDLRLTKEQVRGALADLAHGLEGEVPETYFRYLGDAQIVSGWQPAAGKGVKVTAQLDGEGLRFGWEDGQGAGPLRASAQDFLRALRSLIEHCNSAAVAVYTPSDFPDADLSQEELDKLFS
ncbi:MAG TPA: phosphopantetheine-binding protein, partial [Thermoanaerobaculia bacterium]